MIYLAVDLQLFHGFLEQLAVVEEVYVAHKFRSIAMEVRKIQ